MRFPGIGSRAKKAAHWISSRFVGGGLILGYHRIATVSQDPYNLCVTPQHFQKHLEALRRYANPVTLEELVRGLQDGSLLRNAVAITLDDGYADNLYYAKPLLESYQIPATVYVATGYMGREFWWDELERLLLSPAVRPDQLAQPPFDDFYEWATGDSAALAKLNKNVSVPGHHLFWSAYHRMLPLPYREQEKAMARIRNLAGSELTEGPYSRALTANELIELATGTLLDIGAHSMTHPVMSELSLAAQQVEIQGSKNCLEEIIGRPITSFAYPHGSPSAETSSIVRDAGFFCACASSHGVAWGGSNFFTLPRFWIPDCDGKAFSRWLKRWLRN